MSPIYSYRCEDCSVVQEEIRCIKDRNEPIECGLCGKNMELQIDAVHGTVKNPAVPRSTR